MRIYIWSFCVTGKAFEFEFDFTEIDEKLCFNASDIQVVDNPDLMLWGNGPHLFFLNKEIRAEVITNIPMKVSFDKSLSPDKKSGIRKYDNEYPLINEFQKPVSKLIDYLTGPSSD